MRADSEHAKKSISDSKTRIYGIAALCVLLLYILMAAFGLLKQIRQKPSKTSPPDLRRCTHLEIHNPRIIEFPSLTGIDPNFLSTAETDSLQSLKKFVIDDKKRIRALARVVSSGSYKGVLKRDMPMPPMGKPILSIVCYRNDEHIASITVFGWIFVTDKGHEFSYDINLINLANLFLLAPKHIKPLMLRMQCGSHLWLLYDESLWPYKKKKAYPSPTGWCDLIVRDTRDSELSGKEIRELLKCPGPDEGKSTYAINPECKPDSPPETVLLFETKAGWNQHGGPELFSFDNHDPKGGCVLLNDGTVKFIRTTEELQQLRWK